MEQEDFTRALSIRQPWASAIAIGSKLIETRSWKTNYRGKLLIHAGANTDYMPYKKRAIPRRYDRKQVGFNVRDAAGIGLYEELPLGALIAVCDLMDCKYASAELLGSLSEQELSLGDFTEGRLCWLLGNVRKLPEPIPYKGALGLFKVDNSVWRLHNVA